MKEEAAVGCCIAALISRYPTAFLSSTAPSCKQQKRTEDEPDDNGNDEDEDINTANVENDDKTANRL